MSKHNGKERIDKGKHLVGILREQEKQEQENL